MKSNVPRGSLWLTLLLLAGSTIQADDYVCSDPDGCSAFTGGEGEIREFSFREGDLISTEGGWIIRDGDGWTPAD